MFRMNTAALRTTLEQLQQATRDHAEWHENLVRTLVCGLAANPDDLAENAWHLCRFGRWYYGAVSAELRGLDTFAAMEAEHERVHRAGAGLLRASMRGERIPREAFDELVELNDCLRRELDSLRHEIQDILRSSDVLTGAHGRARLLPELRQWRELARRDVQDCCLVFMDVDHLKEINDTHGHPVGDAVLAGAVAYASRHLRAYDKIYRYGGDEFLLILPAIDLPDATRLVDRIRDGFGEVSLATGADGEPVHATASFGLAVLDPDVVVEESIDRADKALLLAKAAGRNRVIAWDPTVTTRRIAQFAAECEPAG